MAAGDEWVHVPSLQEEGKEAAEAETAAGVAAAPTAGEDKTSENTSDGGVDAEENNNEATTDEARSDCGSYGTTEVDDYLDGIEEEQEPEDEEATGDAVAAAEEALSALNIDEAAGARGKEEVVVKNPFYDDYYSGAEAAYYGGYGYYGAGYGSSSVSLGSYVGSASRGYEDIYGAADGYNRYGYAGDAYGYEPAYGYGYGDAYGYCYGGGGYAAGYYGGPPYEPRYHPLSVVYRGPPAYGFLPLYPPPAYQYAGPALAPPGAGPSDAASRGLRRR